MRMGGRRHHPAKKVGSWETKDGTHHAGEAAGAAWWEFPGGWVQFKRRLQAHSTGARASEPLDGTPRALNGLHRVRRGAAAVRTA